MRFGRWALWGAMVAVGAGCRLDSTYGEGVIHCTPDSICPAGGTCDYNGFCVHATGPLALRKGFPVVRYVTDDAANPLAPDKLTALPQNGRCEVDFGFNWLLKAPPTVTLSSPRVHLEFTSVGPDFLATVTVPPGAAMPDGQVSLTVSADSVQGSIDHEPLGVVVVDTTAPMPPDVTALSIQRQASGDQLLGAPVTALEPDGGEPVVQLFTDTVLVRTSTARAWVSPLALPAGGSPPTLRSYDAAGNVSPSTQVPLVRLTLDVLPTASLRPLQRDALSQPGDLPPADPSRVEATGGAAWVSPAPGDRYPVVGSAMTFDQVRGRSLSFGGVLNNLYFGELLETRGMGWNRATVSGVSPPARAHAGFAWLPSKDAAFLFGGRGAAAVTNDLWRFDGETWSLLTVGGAIPSPRFGAAFVYSARHGGLVLHGGLAADLTALNDTWVFDGTTWRRLTTATPPPRANMAVTSAVIGGQQGVATFGGRVAAGLADAGLWFLTDDWRQVSDIFAGPGPRTQGALYDDGAGLTLVGGADSNSLDGGLSFGPPSNWRYEAGAWTQGAGGMVGETHLLPVPNSARVALITQECGDAQPSTGLLTPVDFHVSLTLNTTLVRTSSLASRLPARCSNRYEPVQLPSKFAQKSEFLTFFDPFDQVVDLHQPGGWVDAPRIPRPPLSPGYGAFRWKSLQLLGADPSGVYRIPPQPGTLPVPPVRVSDPPEAAWLPANGMVDRFNDRWAIVNAHPDAGEQVWVLDRITDAGAVWNPGKVPPADWSAVSPMEGPTWLFALPENGTMGTWSAGFVRAQHQSITNMPLVERFGATWFDNIAAYVTFGGLTRGPNGAVASNETHLVTKTATGYAAQFLTIVDPEDDGDPAARIGPAMWFSPLGCSLTGGSDGASLLTDAWSLDYDDRRPAVLLKPALPQPPAGYAIDALTLHLKVNARTSDKDGNVEIDAWSVRTWLNGQWTPVASSTTATLDLPLPSTLVSGLVAAPQVVLTIEPNSTNGPVPAQVRVLSASIDVTWKHQ